MNSESDRARLITAVTLAAEMALGKPQPGDTFETLLCRAGEVMSGLSWQITSARDLKLSASRWIRHPWHCYKLRNLVRLLLSGALRGPEEAAATIMLNRCAAMIEFGVDVDVHWYRRLREIVIDKQMTAKELRSLLDHSTVWWGTAATTQDQSNLVVRLIFGLWSMGRPTDGQLFIKTHHWLVKSLIVFALIFSGCAFGVVALGFVLHGLAYGPVSAISSYFFTSFTYGWGFCVFWSLGPASWRAVPILQKILRI